MVPAPNVSVVSGPFPSQTVQWVDDNLTISIVSLFFCCLLGIFAVLKSSEAKDAQQRGDYNTAVTSARKAKKLAVSAIVIGIILAVVGFVGGVVVRLALYASLQNDDDYD
ncbi:interferon-induced transmembrane protein [Elysia marginata]|uniref:Interferon-induced transmembrane protein n=1 Tax=Elysia marginata TaxID=1093978 RepID=A0AAV4GGH7_9GAST|nr:interferon-induced transmembrane protein [Elysia marginata]